RSGREQQFVFLGERLLEDVSDDIGWLVNIAQTMRFIDHNEIPRRAMDIRGLVAGELVRSNDESVVDLERAEAIGANGGDVGLGLKGGAGQKKFLGKLLVPLFAKIGWRD